MKHTCNLHLNVSYLYSVVIEKCLCCVLSSDIDRVLIRGVSKRWMPHSSVYDSAACVLGKEEHLARVTTDLYNMHRAIIQSHEIVLIDDDAENVEVARRFGHFAYEVKPDVTVSDIAAFAESLQREALPVACYVQNTDSNSAAGVVASSQGNPCADGQSQTGHRRAVSAYNMVNQECLADSSQPQRTHSIHFVLVNGTYQAI